MSRAASLNESYPAVAASVPLVRAALIDLATAGRADPDELDAIRLATSEALTNVVVHAYDGAPGLIHVTAMLASGELWIVIADDGGGFGIRRRSPGLGAGLALIAQACDGFEVLKRASGGTEVRMRFGLRVAAPARAAHPRGSLASARNPA